MKTRPRYPILTQCTIVPKLRRKGPCRGFYQRTVVTSGGVGSCTYLPAILWATRDYRARTHQDDYRGGEQINEGQPFFVLNLDGGGDEGSVPYPALDKALIEAARGRMPLIYGPPATFSCVTTRITDPGTIGEEQDTGSSGGRGRHGLAESGAKWDANR